MKYNIVLFDFDGTIADTLPHIVTIIKRNAHQYSSIDPETIDIEHIRSLSSVEILKYFKIPVYKLPFIINQIRSEIYNHIADVKPFPFIIPLFNEMNKLSTTMGIVSSNTLDTVQAFLTNHNLNIFTYIRCEQNIFGKPAVLKSLIHTQSLSAQSILYVGDEIRDVDACKKAGIDIAAVTWGFSTKSALTQKNPTYVVDSEEQLLQIIKN